MSPILQSCAQSLLTAQRFSSPNPESYQTNPNHPQHSKFLHMRLTLMMLWFLRAPLMVRTALIALLLVPFLASSAGASRIDAVHKSARASVAKGTARRTHRAAHPASHASKASSRVRTSNSRHTVRPTTHRSSRSVASARHRSFIPARPSTRMRRARYARSHRAHFVPLATVPVERTRPWRGDSASADPPAFAPAETVSRIERAPATSSSATEAFATTKSPAESLLNDPEAAPDPTGNPLTEPPAETTAPPSSQIAELNVPRVYGRYALRGTHDSLVRQNERSEDEALERIEDDADLQDRIARGLLVHVPETSGLLVNPALPEDRRYCRQWTADFLTDLSRAHEAQFHKPLIVSSAVRTVEYQRHLMRVNHNAADAEGDIVSPHLTGATIDIAKSGLSRREMQWMRDHLFAYQTAGVIDVEEEFRQRCFHITVYKNYAPASSDRPHHAPVPQTVPPDPSTATVSDDPNGSR
jgi:hypothetical protein